MKTFVSLGLALVMTAFAGVASAQTPYHHYRHHHHYHHHHYHHHYRRHP